MDWPIGDRSAENKLRYAITLAGAIGHISLAANDLLLVTLLNSNGNRQWGPYRGHQNSMQLLQFLETAEASGPTNLSLSMTDYALRGRRPGLLFLVSDLLSPRGFRSGLNDLQARGHEVGLIHLLSQDELEPPLVGDLKLIDVETGQDTEISMDAPTADQYRLRLRDWMGDVASYCRGRDVHYIPVSTDTPWEKLIMQTLRTKGILR
jgi:uncharacterized protein (DUF58 family)